MPTKDNSEIHLFIIWEHARDVEKEIIKDLSTKFEIVKTFEMHWSKSKFSQNLSRFYGTQLPPKSRKETHVGTNPFLAVVVRDLKPDYRIHTTSKGDATVNTNLFTTKALHREWTGGGHKIHASNTLKESNHNLTLLFGKNTEDFLATYGNSKTPKKIESWNKDLIGSNGWKSLKELFYVLNNTIDYTVLRNYDVLPGKYYAKDHGDIDLLVSNYKDACFLTNSTPVFKSKNRVYNKLNIDSEEILFDFRFIDDGYYDSAWEQSILDNRTYSNKGFYIPDTDNHFYSLLYHALIQKPKLGKDYEKKVATLHESKSKSFSTSYYAKLLYKFMEENSYSFTQPNDKSVYMNLDLIKNGKTLGVGFNRRKVIPLRNYLKKSNFPLKHYLLKIRKIIRRRLVGIDTN
jgi:hypothetical protein